MVVEASEWPKVCALCLDIGDQVEIYLMKQHPCLDFIIRSRNLIL